MGNKKCECWQGCGETGTFVQPLWKTVGWFPKTLNIELPYDSAIPFLGIYPKDLRTGTQILVSGCSWKHYLS